MWDVTMIIQTLTNLAIFGGVYLAIFVCVCTYHMKYRGLLSVWEITFYIYLSHNYHNPNCMT